VPAVWRGGAVGGFVSDWAEWQRDKGLSAWAPAGTEPKASYDAIRVYLWAGMLPPKFPGRDQFFQPLEPMVKLVRNQQPPPEAVLADGQLQGVGSVGFSAAVIPLLTTLGEVRSLGAQKQRLQQLFDPASHLYGKPARYYDQCLVLFSQGWSEGRFRFDESGQLIVRWSANP
jgi:endoglucanase